MAHETDARRASPLLDAILKVRENGTLAAVVVAKAKKPASADDVKGILAKEQIADAVLEALYLF